MATPPDKLSSVSPTMPAEGGDATALRTVIQSGTVEGLSPRPTSSKGAAKPSRSASALLDLPTSSAKGSRGASALLDLPTGSAKGSRGASALLDPPTGSTKAPVRAKAGVAQPAKPKVVAVSPAGLANGSKLHTALKATATPDAAGSFDAAVPVLENLSVAEAEEALVGLLVPAPNREMSLVYKNGKLVSANIGVTKADDAPNAQAPLPTDMGLADTVVTHTHPDGSPLSRGDVSVAVKNNLLEIRAAGPNGAFALRRKGDAWGFDPTKVFDHYSTIGAAAWQKSAPANAGELRPDPEKEKDGKKQGETFLLDGFMAEHYACKTLAETFGCDYIHPTESALVALRTALYQVRTAKRGDDRAGTQGDVKPVTMGGGSKSI